MYNDLLLFISGPSTSSGKLGNALFFPNTGKHDDNVLRLGSHSNDCFGNVSLCPNGLTFALWFKLESQITGWSHPFHGIPYRPYFETYLNSYKPHINLLNATHLHAFHGIPVLSYGEWHHLGITYDATSGFAVYIDGCVPADNTILKSTVNWAIPNDFVLGCEGGTKCTRVHLDDLRFWTAKKSALFIWHLWKMYG